MSDELKQYRTELHEECDTYANIGTLLFQLLTLPIWLPIWLYVVFVHRRPGRCIRERFKIDRPHDELVAFQVDRKMGKRMWGHASLRSGRCVQFEYHRDLDVLTLYETP
jgi:hypothetical protein